VGIKIRCYLGELLKNVFSINFLNFDLGAFLMEPLEVLS
jgi:hypothetical protein